MGTTPYNTPYNTTPYNTTPCNTTPYIETPVITPVITPVTTPVNVAHQTPATPFTPYDYTPGGFDPIKTQDLLQKKRARRNSRMSLNSNKRLSLNSNRRNSSIKKGHTPSSRKPRLLPSPIRAEIRSHPRAKNPSKKILPSPLRSGIQNYHAEHPDFCATYSTQQSTLPEPSKAEHEQVDSKEEQQLVVTEEVAEPIASDIDTQTSISLVGNEKKEEHDEHDDTETDTLVEQNEAQDEALLNSKSAPLIHSTTNPETQSITSDMDLGTQNTSVADVKSNVDNSLHSPIRKSKRRPKSVRKSTRSKKKINKIPQEKSKTKGVNLELVMEVVEHQEKRATRSLRK